MKLVVRHDYQDVIMFVLFFSQSLEYYLVPREEAIIISFSGADTKKLQYASFYAAIPLTGCVIKFCSRTINKNVAEVCKSFDAEAIRRKMNKNDKTGYRKCLVEALPQLDNPESYVYGLITIPLDDPLRGKLFIQSIGRLPMAIGNLVVAGST